MGFWDSVKKGVTDTASAAWDGTQKTVICLDAINKVNSDVQGHDPRTWMTACAKETIFKGKGPDYFKKCLENKIRKEAKDISDPVGYANHCWDQIKGGCS